MSTPTPDGSMQDVVLGLLHTGAMHPPVFDALIKERIAGDPLLGRAQIVHVTDAWLLETVIEDGVSPLVGERVAEHVTGLERRGANAVLVTCSSIGEVTENVAESASVPVVRIDVAMAAEAVTAAVNGPGGLTVLATLESTMGPTTRLVERAAAGQDVAVRGQVVENAIARRDAGDQEGHDALVARTIEQALADGDVVVLAQASMAGALRSPNPRVFTSPMSAVEALLDAARSRPQPDSATRSG